MAYRTLNYSIIVACVFAVLSGYQRRSLANEYHLVWEYHPEDASHLFFLHRNLNPAIQTYAFGEPSKIHAKLEQQSLFIDKAGKTGDTLICHVFSTSFFEADWWLPGTVTYVSDRTLRLRIPFPDEELNVVFEGTIILLDEARFLYAPDPPNPEDRSVHFIKGARSSGQILLPLKNSIFREIRLDANVYLDALALKPDGKLPYHRFTDSVPIRTIDGTLLAKDIEKALPIVIWYDGFMPMKFLHRTDDRLFVISVYSDFNPEDALEFVVVIDQIPIQLDSLLFDEVSPIGYGSYHIQETNPGMWGSTIPVHSWWNDPSNGDVSELSFQMTVTDRDNLRLGDAEEVDVRVLLSHPEAPEIIKDRRKLRKIESDGRIFYIQLQEASHDVDDE